MANGNSSDEYNDLSDNMPFAGRYCIGSLSCFGYSVEDSEVTVLACTHGRADPGKLLKRLYNLDLIKNPFSKPKSVIM